MRKYSDEEINDILHESLKCNEKSDDGLNLKLKNKLIECTKQKRKRVISIWWVPAVAGTVATLAFIGLFLYYMPNSVVSTCLSLFGAVSILFSWCLTIFGVRKFGLMKEACI